MNTGFKPLLILLFSVSCMAFGQQVTKKDTLSGTPLTISMDDKVEKLLSDMENNCVRVAANNASKTGSSSGSNSSYKPAKSTTPERISVPSRALTNAEICRQNPRILGYKIQLTVVKSNEEANEVKAYFRRRFPNLKVETDASLRPNYKILAGSYFSKSSASGDLGRIRQYFKSAVPVQYRVFCVEAK